MAEDKPTVVLEPAGVAVHYQGRVFKLPPQRGMIIRALAEAEGETVANKQLGRIIGTPELAQSHLRVLKRWFASKNLPWFVALHYNVGYYIETDKVIVTSSEARRNTAVQAPAD